MAKELYKLFQIVDVFVNKYDYTQVVLQEYKDNINDEAWLFNSSNKNYQVIRVSFSSAVRFDYDKERVNKYLSYFNQSSKIKGIKFLDIFISNDKYDIEYEPFDYINIEENYNNGVNLYDFYPEIYSSIHKVSDPQKEINNIVSRMRKKIKEKLKARPFLKRNPYIITYLVICLCILNYVLGLYLKYKYNDVSSIFVVLGADYKTFTLGLNQFYRLFTYAFVHNDIIHLLCNLYSFNSIGRFVEVKYGHLKFSLILLFSIICGSLTQGILSDNSVCLGLSAGIYGLLVVFIIDTVKSGIIDIRKFIPLICINLFLNFLSNVAWTAHLGGAIGGFVMMYLLEDVKNPARIILCACLILCLIYKYVTIDSIKSLYTGTDLEVINMYKDFGLKNYALKLFNKLLQAYERLGG